jgi:sec-independent protein translocase protein TatB
MFGIGSTELLIILVVALIILGPSKLPEVMRTLGKGMAEFKRMSTDVKSTLDAEVKKAEDEDKKKQEAAKKKTAPKEKPVPDAGISIGEATPDPTATVEEKPAAETGEYAEAPESPAAEDKPADTGEAASTSDESAQTASSEGDSGKDKGGTGA